MVKNPKCCLPSCRSTRQENKLFFFPSNETLRDLWTQVLSRHCPFISNLTPQQLKYRWVCKKHFEAKYLLNGNRRLNSVPTLFSEEEIASGEPAFNFEFPDLPIKRRPRHESKKLSPVKSTLGLGPVVVKLKKRKNKLIKVAVSTGLTGQAPGHKFDWRNVKFIKKSMSGVTTGSNVNKKPSNMPNVPLLVTNVEQTLVPTVLTLAGLDKIFNKNNKSDVVKDKSEVMDLRRIITSEGKIVEKSTKLPDNDSKEMDKPKKKKKITYCKVIDKDGKIILKPAHELKKVRTQTTDFEKLQYKTRVKPAHELKKVKTQKTDFEKLQVDTGSNSISTSTDTNVHLENVHIFSDSTNFLYKVPEIPPSLSRLKLEPEEKAEPLKPQFQGLRTYQKKPQRPKPKPIIEINHNTECLPNEKDISVEVINEMDPLAHTTQMSVINEMDPLAHTTQMSVINEMDPLAQTQMSDDDEYLNCEVLEEELEEDELESIKMEEDDGTDLLRQEAPLFEDIYVKEEAASQCSLDLNRRKANMRVLPRKDVSKSTLIRNREKRICKLLQCLRTEIHNIGDINKEEFNEDIFKDIANYLTMNDNQFSLLKNTLERKNHDDKLVIQEKIFSIAPNEVSDKCYALLYTFRFQ